MDTMTPAARSALMAKIRSKNTKAEITVRSFVHGLGYRFRLHDQRLPGSPDIVLPRLRTVILVHGCFWHRHNNCRFAYTPKTRVDFWSRKFAQNVERDRRVRDSLQKLGWKVTVVWECEIGNPGRLLSKLERLLTRIDSSMGTGQEKASREAFIRSRK